MLLRALALALDGATIVAFVVAVFLIGACVLAWWLLSKLAKVLR